MQASGAAMRLLQESLDESGRTLAEATLFAADLGPGSFTGVKVAVTLAKTLAFAQKVLCIGSDSFDLIDADGTVVMPSKRGEWFLRRPGQAPTRQTELPEEAFTGFGPGIAEPVFPQAAKFAVLLKKLDSIEPEKLVPNYLIEPSISVPKKPLSPLRGTSA